MSVSNNGRKTAKSGKKAEENQPGKEIEIVGDVLAEESDDGLPGLSGKTDSDEEDDDVAGATVPDVHRGMQHAHCLPKLGDGRDLMAADCAGELFVVFDSVCIPTDVQ